MKRIIAAGIIRRSSPGPDLPAESILREAEARSRAAALTNRDTTRTWPDPYGPDPIVFGPPRTARAPEVTA